MCVKSRKLFLLLHVPLVKKEKGKKIYQVSLSENIWNENEEVGGRNKEEEYEAKEDKKSETLKAKAKWKRIQKCNL